MNPEAAIISQIVMYSNREGFYWGMFEDKNRSHDILSMPITSLQIEKSC